MGEKPGDGPERRAAVMPAHGLAGHTANILSGKTARSGSPATAKYGRVVVRRQVAVTLQAGNAIQRCSAMLRYARCGKRTAFAPSKQRRQQIGRVFADVPQETFPALAEGVLLASVYGTSRSPLIKVDAARRAPQ